MTLKSVKWPAFWLLLLPFLGGVNDGMADDETVDPRDSLVVIHNAISRKGNSEYCIGVLTGKQEVMAPAPCADTHFSTLTVCKDMSSCVQTVDDSEKRQGVSLAYESKGFKVKNSDDNRIVKLELEEPLQDIQVAKVVSFDAAQVQCDAVLDCILLARSVNNSELKWHSRSMKRDCKNADTAGGYDVVYVGEFAHPENFTVIAGAAFFDGSGRFVGMTYNWEMIFHRNEKEPVSCSWADYAVTVRQAKFEL